MLKATLTIGIALGVAHLFDWLRFPPLRFVRFVVVTTIGKKGSLFAQQGRSDAFAQVSRFKQELIDLPQDSIEGTVRARADAHDPALCNRYS